LDREARAAGVKAELSIRNGGELAPLALPAEQLGGDRALLQDPDAVEVLYVVDGVRDVVGYVHDGRLDGLLPWCYATVERSSCLTQVLQLGAVGAELRRPAGGVARRRGGPPRRWVEAARMRVGVREAGPWILQHRRPYGSGQVQPGPRRAADLGARDDPVRLGVALEAVGEPEPLPGQPIQHPLTEVPERRMAKVVSERCGLHHVGIAPAELLQQVLVARVARQPFG